MYRTAVCWIPVTLLGQCCSPPIQRGQDTKTSHSSCVRQRIIFIEPFFGGCTRRWNQNAHWIPPLQGIHCAKVLFYSMFIVRIFPFSLPPVSVFLVNLIPTWSHLAGHYDIQCWFRACVPPIYKLTPWCIPRNIYRTYSRVIYAAIYTPTFECIFL